MTDRISLSLDRDVLDLLEQVGERGRSHYLSGLVRDAWRDWTEALEHLRRLGWRRREVLAAADALNGLWLLDRQPIGSVLALELHDAARLDRAVSKWELDGERWRATIDRLRRSDGEAWALWVVVREIWRDNAAIEGRIDALDQAR